MRKYVLISVGILALAILATASFAQADMRGGCMQGGGMMGGMGHQEMGMMPSMGPMMEGNPMMMWKHLMSLGLDEKQKDALKALRSRTMKEMVKRGAEKQIADIELKDLMDKDPVDVKAVEATAKKSSAIAMDMFLAHVKAHEEMKTILTPDQRKQLKELMTTEHGPGCMMDHDKEHKDMPMHEHVH